MTAAELSTKQNQAEALQRQTASQIESGRNFSDLALSLLGIKRVEVTAVVTARKLHRDRAVEALRNR